MTPHKREAEATHENPSPKRSKSDVTGVSSKSEKAVSGDASKVTCIEADASEDKGCRQRMEVAYFLLPDANLEHSRNLRCTHFAIYDGHGGRLAAEFEQKNLHANVLAAGLPRNWQDGATAVCVWVLDKLEAMVLCIAWIALYYGSISPFSMSKQLI